MAITKVSGHVIEPTTNIQAGIITATRFDGPIGSGTTDGNFSGIITAVNLNVTGVGTFNGIGVTSLNVTGVSTFAGNINANGNIVAAGDITANGNITGDGSTNITGIAGVTASTLTGTLQTAAQTNITSVGTLSSLNVTGNATIGGVLTYADVTNIDSLGIVTARTGIKVLAGGINAVGVVTATSFVGDGGSLTGIAGTAHVRTATLTVSGVSTFSELVKFDANIGTTPSASGNVHIYRHDNKLKVCGGSGIQFEEGGFTRWHITNGALHPHGTTYNNLGTTSNLVGHAYFGDSKKIHLGNDQDFTLYHNNSHAYIQNSTGSLLVEGNTLVLRSLSQENYLVGNVNGAVNLYYDASAHATAKLATTATGITVGGEVAASQDYPNYRSTLDFNFAAVKKLDPRIRYKRTGPASYIDEKGIVRIVGDNAPRFDHDQDTGECKGLLIEETRTNLFPYGRTPGDNWSSSKSGTFTQNTTETTAPDGTYTATKWTFTNTDPYIYHTQTLNANTTYTMSMWVKAGTNMSGDVLQMRMGASPYSTNANSTISTDGSWKRLTFTKTVGGSAENSASVGFEPQTNPSGNPAVGDVIYIWGAQLEAGSVVSSLIPTDGSTVTRGSDNLIIDGEDFTDFFNAIEGTIFADYKVVGGHPEIMYLSNNQSSRRIGLYEAGSNQTRFIIGNGGTQADTTSAATAIGDNVKAAGAYKLNDIAAVKDGGTPSTDSSATIPSDGMSRAYIGGYYDGTVEGVLELRRLMYYSKRLPNSQLITLTS